MSAVLCATVLDFKEHPSQITLFLSITLAVGAAARDESSQAQHCEPAQYKNRHFLGDFQCQGYFLPVCRSDEPQGVSKLRRHFQPSHVPQKWMGWTGTEPGEAEQTWCPEEEEKEVAYFLQPLTTSHTSATAQELQSCHIPHKYFPNGHHNAAVSPGYGQSVTSKVMV